MGLIMGAIADDFTGAVELAALLRRGGLRAAVLTRRAQPADAEDLQCAVVALKIRVAPINRALDAVEDALRLLAPHSPRQIYYKYCATFDSTPRGNIGPIADRLLQEVPTPLTLFCPAFPEVDRTVYAGHLFVGSDLVSRSPKRFDPLTPMREPDLVRVLQAQSRWAVGLLRRAADVQGLWDQARRLQQSGIVHAIADAVDEADLARIAELSVDWPLVTGGSSLAAHYPPLWRVRGYLGESTIREEPGWPRTLPKVPGHGVVLSGSCAERTLEQLEAFSRRRPVLRLDPASDAPIDRLAETAADWARERLGSGPVAIATSVPPEGLVAGRSRWGRLGSARRAERLLAELATKLATAGVRRWVVAGGETSGAVVDALGIHRLDVEPYAEPGIAKTATSGRRPHILHLKSGKLGPVSMFADLLIDNGRLGVA